MTTRNTSRQAVLQWREPWWFWQGLALMASTLLAPTFVTVAVLLTRDARSDHPVFWPLLMAIVLLGNMLATAGVNQLQHRRPAAGRAALVLRYGAFSMPAGALMFLAAGFGTGFLPDFFTTAVGQGVAHSTAVVWSVALAGAYSLMSFAHAGLVYAWAGFAAAADANRPPRPAWEPLL